MSISKIISLVGLATSIIAGTYSLYSDNLSLREELTQLRSSNSECHKYIVKQNTFIDDLDTQSKLRKEKLTTAEERIRELEKSHTDVVQKLTRSTGTTCEDTVKLLNDYIELTHE